MKISIVSGGLILLTITSALSAANSPAPVRLTATETVLGDMNQALPTPDGNHNISFKGMGDVIGAIVIDGKVIEVPPGFIRNSQIISSDGKRLAYTIKKNDKTTMVIDGKDDRSYEHIFRPLVFSPNSERTAYIGQNGWTQFSWTQFAVIDGKESSPYYEISLPVFSPDSKHVTYVVHYNINPATKFEGRCRLVLDGVEGKEYGDNQHVDIFMPTFSPDSKRLAFTVMDGKQDSVVVDGVEEQPFDAIYGPILFSPDSKRFAYLAKRHGEFIIVVDGVESAGFDASEQPGQAPAIYFSPDSKQIAYIAKRGDKYYVVVNGAEGKPYEYVDMMLIFSADGKHLAYSAKSGDKQFVVVDGVEGKPYAGAWSPTFSPDGKHLTYWARPNPNFAEQFVVVDGVEGKKYGRPAAGPLFSPDGKHVAYAASQSAGQPFDVIVVDGVEFHPQSPIVFDPRFAMFISKTFYFESPTKLDFVAMKMPTQQFVRETIDIK